MKRYELLLRFVTKWYGPRGVHRLLAFGLFLIMVIGCSYFVRITGGIRFVYAHFMYLPIVLAAILFKAQGGIVVGMLGGVALGPYMPIDTVTGELQTMLNWVFRSGIFMFVGALVGGAVHYLLLYAEQISHYASELEQRVRERTAQLSDQNALLNWQASELESGKEELQYQNDQLAQNQAELELVNHKLQEASSAKSDFLANMSHELRTPLNSILGFSEVLADELAGPLNAKQLDYVNNVYSSGGHLLALVNDILDLSKVEAGKLELDLEKVNLTETVLAVLSLVKETASKRQLTIRETISPDVPTEIVCDQRKVKQILFNLLSNAVKFTPPGGTITLQVTMGDDCGGGNHKPGDYVHISVTDTGIGIPETEWPKLFQEFVQLEAPHTKKYEGTGLGLALSKRLIELHEGVIWFDSTEGVGSCFCFSIPVLDDVAV